MIKVGWTIKLPLASLFFIAAFVFLAGFANAVPQQVCNQNGNGYYDPSINDCRFTTMPSGQVYCDGPQSKYHSTCVGTTYYDYDSYSYPGTYYVNGVAYQGQVCNAVITPNAARCGYSQGSSQQPGNNYNYNYDYSSTTNTNTETNYYYSYPDGSRYNYYGGYCGNRYCEYGENAWNCPTDCYNPFGSHYYSSCYLSAYPGVVKAGGWSDIAVSYTDLFYKPWSIPVNCGNGYVAYAYGALGKSGTAFARCYFPNAGLYYQTAYAGGIGCNPSWVSVLSSYQQPPSGQGGQTGGTGANAQQCSSVANPSELKDSGVSTISVYYSGVSPTGASVSCGDPAGTVKDAVCSNGVCNAQCVYNPSTLPYYAAVDTALKTPSGSLRCSPTFVSIVSSQAQSQQQAGGSVQLQSGSCAVITDPVSLDNNGSSSVSVVYQNFGQNVSSASVYCGNGANVNALCQNNQNGVCSPVNCAYQTPSSFPRKYDVKAAIAGQQCASSSVTIFGQNPTPTPQAQQAQGGIILTVTDGNSNPIENAFAVVYQSGSAVDSGTTDSSGTTAFANLPVGSYSITVSKTGFETRTAGASVVANQNTLVSIQLAQAFASKSCSVSLNPSTARPGDAVSVQVSYSGISSPAYALVSCAGPQLQAPCSGGSQGSCTAQCSFGSEQSYPQYKTVTASVSGVSCNPAQATLIAPVPTQGTLLARVTDCASGSALQGAGINANGTMLYSDSNGLVSVALDPGLYSILVSKDGFASQSVSAQVTAGKTASASVCLNANAARQQANCDFEAQLTSAPQCPYSTVVQPYQVTLKNDNATGNTTVQVLYSTNALTGPSLVTLLPSQQTIVEFNSAISDLAGARNAVVSFASQQCTRNIPVQACMSGGLAVDAAQNTLKALPGENACFNLIVKNKGLAASDVVLSASSSDASVTGRFSQQEFRITPQETKQIDFCVKSYSGGLTSFVINANSDINSASTSVSLDVASQSDYSSNTGSCFKVDSIGSVDNVRISISNNGESGDYYVELTSLENTGSSYSYNRDAYLPLDAQVLQPSIYGFEEGSNRNVIVRLNPFNAQAGEHDFELLLKKDGMVVMQQPVCFDVKSRKTQAIALTPLSLTIQAGKAASAFVAVENQGNDRLNYLVSIPQTLPMQITPNAFTLAPGEKENVEIQITTLPSTNLGSYSIPVRLVSTASTEDTYSVTVYCGSGQSKTVDCKGGSNSCSVSCDFPSTGVYTASASIGGQACASAPVRVSQNYNNSCYLTVNPVSMDEGNYATATVNYQNLGAGQQNNFTVDCGNGNTVVAQNCAGTTGSCSARCLYDDEGSFTVTASSSNYTCLNAGIAVLKKDGGTCRLSAQTNILQGASDTVTLSYDVATLPQESQVLLSTQNLLVNVVSSFAKFEPQVSQNIAVTAPSSLELFPGSTVLLPVTIRNNDNYALNTVMVYLANLPTGVQSDPVQAFSLQPGMQTTRNIVLRAAQDAPLQASTAKLKVESSAFVAPEKQIAVTVRTATAQELLASATESPSFSFTSEGNATEVTVQIPVKNNENSAITVTASASLPAGWRFGFAPVSIKPGETALLSFKLANDQYQDADFDAVIRLQSADSKVKSVPIRVPSKSSATGLTGLFTALSSPAAAVLMLLLVIGIAIAAYLFYAGKDLQTKLDAEVESAGESGQRPKPKT